MWLKIFLFLIGCTSTLSQTPSFNLGGVLSGNRMAGVPLGISLGDGELDVEGICTEPGFACQNCTHAITCVPLPVGYLKVPLTECTKDQTCNAHRQECSDEHVPECQAVTQMYEHTCEQVGIFPDAHDCRRFHLCSPPEGLPFGRPADHRIAFCPRHYSYDAHTAQCSIRLHKGQCREKLVPECERIGQNGALQSSPNHYYVCLIKKGVLYPQVFLCPHGWYFLDSYCRAKEDHEKAKATEATAHSGDAKDKNNTSTSVEEIFTTTEADPLFETTIVEEAKEATTMSKIESFFSTEKSSTFAPDAFLADKFDLTNYESTDDAAPYNNNNYDYSNVFDTGNEFW